MLDLSDTQPGMAEEPVRSAMNKAKITKINNEDYVTVEISEDRPDIIDYFGDKYAKGKTIKFPVSRVIPPSISWRK